VTARHTLVEAHRNLARLVAEPAARAVALGSVARDWQRMHIVEIDAVTCETASAIVETTGARTLDARSTSPQPSARSVPAARS
jgi:hypothetical protein